MQSLRQRDVVVTPEDLTEIHSQIGKAIAEKTPMGSVVIIKKLVINIKINSAHGGGATVYG